MTGKLDGEGDIAMEFVGEAGDCWTRHVDILFTELGLGSSKEASMRGLLRTTLWQEFLGTNSSALTKSGVAR